MQKEQRQRSVGAPGLETRQVSEFDRARQRFGAWGMVKGRLLAEMVGEERALGMFRGVRSPEDFAKLRRDINSQFQESLEAASRQPNGEQEFLEAGKRAIRSELGIDKQVDIEKGGLVRIHNVGASLFQRDPEPNWSK